MEEHPFLDRLKVERRLDSRTQPEHAEREEAKRAMAVHVELARAERVRRECPVEEPRSMSSRILPSYSRSCHLARRLTSTRASANSDITGDARSVLTRERLGCVHHLRVSATGAPHAAERPRELRVGRRTLEVLAVEAGRERDPFELGGAEDRAAFVQEIGRDGLGVVVARERPAQNQSLRGSTRGLIEEVLLAPERVTRSEIHEREPELLQVVTLVLGAIQSPRARSGNWPSTSPSMMIVWKVRPRRSVAASSRTAPSVAPATRNS